MSTLKDKVIFITGASRGIGREIALRAAKDGAKIVIAAKTDQPLPNLPGTIHTVADEVKALGGDALALCVDVRSNEAIQQAVQKAAEHFGGIDVLINNASAISLTPTLQTPAKKFDLMFAVNVRATFLCAQACLPYLKKSTNPHIVTLSPPLNMKPKWFKNHVVYTMSKYGMSMCTLGLSEEFKADKIAVNSMWPKTTIATAAIAANFPKEIYENSRKPSIVSDAIYALITTEGCGVTGQFLVDEDWLRASGVTDFTQYNQGANAEHLVPDFFLD